MIVIIIPRLLQGLKVLREYTQTRKLSDGQIHPEGLQRVRRPGYSGILSARSQKHLPTPQQKEEGSREGQDKGGEGEKGLHKCCPKFYKVLNSLPIFATWVAAYKSSNLAFHIQKFWKHTELTAVFPLGMVCRPLPPVCLTTFTCPGPVVVGQQPWPTWSYFLSQFSLWEEDWDFSSFSLNGQRYDLQSLRKVGVISRPMPLKESVHHLQERLASCSLIISPMEKIMVGTFCHNFGLH